MTRRIIAPSLALAALACSSSVTPPPPGRLVVAEASFVTTERGESATLTIMLSAQPSADVTVPIASSDPSEASVEPPSIVFTPENWNQPRIVTATGADDDEIDGNQSFQVAFGPSVSTDFGFADLRARSRDLTNVDDESAAILVSAASGPTTEAGGRATFTVRLGAQPSAPVTLAFSSSDRTEGTLEVSMLTFAPGDSTQPQTVTVIGADDDEVDGEQPYTVSIDSIASADATYAGLARPPAVSLVNVDNDAPGIAIVVASATTTEAGGTARFSVVLRSSPQSDVTLALASNDPSEGVTGASSLTFTSASWDTPQDVIVTGRDDAEFDGDRTYFVVFEPPVSAGSDYGSLAAPSPVALTNVDDDVASPVLRNRTQVNLALSSQTTISYGGYLNGESFQQDGILTYNGYQYAAYWNAASRVVLARRPGGEGAWSKIEMDPTYTGTSGDAHNTISLGVSPTDGRLHVAFDHHVSPLHYVRSIPNLVSEPATTPWETASFERWTSTLGTTTISQVTYPRFITEPGGRLLLEYRYGSSGSGDQVLWEYDRGTWTSVGMYIRGIADDINAYIHGIEYQGTRLHVAWCWRETPDASTNHDLFYIYSDDNGRTWRNNAGTMIGTAGSAPVSTSTAGIRVWTIPQNRGLINQEHMTVDNAGRVHVLLSHMPDSEADQTNFTTARARSQYFHYWRATDGTWTRVPMGFPSELNFRGKLAVSSTDNLYAVLPDLRIASASASTSWTNWTLIETSHDGEFFSDPLIDRSRLEIENVLTVFAPIAPAATVTIETINYEVE